METSQQETFREIAAALKRIRKSLEKLEGVVQEKLREIKGRPQ